MLLVCVRDWLDPVAVGAQLGFGPIAKLGHASLRADVGGFFGTAGLLSLGAALRDDHRLLMAPMLLIGLALLGRVIALGFVGFDAVLVPPMVVEAVMLGLFAAGRKTLG